MKLLGEYSSPDADMYKDILLANGIEAKLGLDPAPAIVDDLVRGKPGRTYIYVPEEALDKARNVINDYETKNIVEKKEFNEKFNSIIPNIFIVTGAVLILIWLASTYLFKH